MKAKIPDLFRPLRTNGAFEAARLGVTKIRERLGWWIDAGFDRRHGTDTTGIVPVESTGVTGASAQAAVHYEASPARIFVYALTHVVPAPSGYVFIDYGSGKGRALLLASHFPFKRIVGVEHSRILHAIAQRNIEIYRSKARRCFDVTSVCSDAAEFDLPDDDLVLYFYTPFHDPVLGKVLERIEASYARRPRGLIVIAYSSDAEDILQMAAMRCITRRSEVRVPHDPTRIAQRRLLVMGTDHVL